MDYNNIQSIQGESKNSVTFCMIFMKKLVCVLKKSEMGNFCNLISCHRNASFQTRSSHTKVTVIKVKVSNFSAEQTAYESQKKKKI